MSTFFADFKNKTDTLKKFVKLFILYYNIAG